MKHLIFLVILLICVSCFKNSTFDTVNSNPPVSDSENERQGTPNPTPGSPVPTPTPAPTPTPPPGSPNPWPTPHNMIPLKNSNNKSEELILTASLGRNDGIFLSLNKEYKYDWKIFTTMNPEYCLSKNYQLPLPDGVEEIASGDSFNYQFQPFLDTSAPEDIFYCYMFTGRGIVEASTWGFRIPKENFTNQLTIKN